MPNQFAPLSRIFHALADPTRLAVVERLSRGPATVTELAQGFDMALPSFMQHLKVLEEAGLVISHKAGRSRICRVAPQAIKVAEDWLRAQRSIWDRRLDQLDAFLEQLKENEP